MFSIQALTGAGIGAAGMLILAVGVYSAVLEPRAKAAGVAEERGRVLERSIEVIKGRDKLNATVKTLSDDDLCRRLGGVPNKGECD